MTKIVFVEPDSLAFEAGIEPGDMLMAVNGREIRDILEFKFITADEEFEITVKKTDGSIEVIDVINDYGEDFGVEFENALMTKARSCANKCVFCFIDQLPEGMRETLYFKDDDSRLSFLQGNYITMTNMSEKDIDSIVMMHMSPINVSVHTTNPGLREFMLGNKRAGRLMQQLKRLCDAGIMINCQIVLCPGINDGEELERTLTDLSGFLPSVYSISVVPVGMTKFRKGLYKLEPYTGASSADVLNTVEKWQKKFIKLCGRRTLYAADEFYIMAGRSFPPYEDYEDFPQLENGVGMSAVTIDEFMSELSDGREGVFKRATVVTGVISAPIIRELVSEIKGIDAEVVGIRNEFFGESITVSGLVTATDIINQLSGRVKGRRLFIPSNMLRADTDVFLDDLTVGDVERALDVTVTVTENGGHLARELLR